MHLCEKAYQSTKYLKEQDFSNKQILSLHQFSLRSNGVMTLNIVIDYFSKNKNLQKNNNNFAHRLIFIAHQHKQGKGEFPYLIEQALKKWPMGYDGILGDNGISEDKIFNLELERNLYMPTCSDLENTYRKFLNPNENIEESHLFDLYEKNTNKQLSDNWRDKLKGKCFS